MAEIKPSLTYRLDREKGRIHGRVDGLDAVRQAVHLILSTERYGHLIYSADYGSEHSSLIGEDMDHAISEVKSRVEEALLQDDRITAVDSFEFERSGRRLRAAFVVRTVFGDFESEVNI